MMGYNGVFSGCVTVIFSLYPNVAFTCWPYGEIICLIQVKIECNNLHLN